MDEKTDLEFMVSAAWSGGAYCHFFGMTESDAREIARNLLAQHPEFDQVDVYRRVDRVRRPEKESDAALSSQVDRDYDALVRQAANECGVLEVLRVEEERLLRGLLRSLRELNPDHSFGMRLAGRDTHWSLAITTNVSAVCVPLLSGQTRIQPVMALFRDSGIAFNEPWPLTDTQKEIVEKFKSPAERTMVTNLLLTFNAVEWTHQRSAFIVDCLSYAQSTVLAFWLEAQNPALLVEVYLDGTAKAIRFASSFLDCVSFDKMLCDACGGEK